MPLKRMLDDNRTFGLKAVAVLQEAFNGVVAELGLRTRAEREGHQNNHPACNRPD
jgi:hypothetical protein